MKSIIQAIYEGKIQPIEQIAAHGSEYNAVNEKISGEKEYFKNMLTPDDYCRFEELESLYEKSSAFQDKEIFKYAFRLGALIMLEISEKNDNWPL